MVGVDRVACGTTRPWAACALAIALLAASEAAAVTINPGDILVADQSAFGGPGAVIRVDPVTGAQTTVSSGGFFSDPWSIAIAANGDIMVGDSLAFGGPCAIGCGGVIRVNPATGAQTVVSSGGNFVTVTGITIAANGDILVADQGAFGGPCAFGCGGVIRVNPATGAQTTVSSGGFFNNPGGIAIDANGDILVADNAAFGGPGGVIRVDPGTGAQTVVSSGGSFADPFGLAIAANGDILVAHRRAFGAPGSVIRVDPVTGAQTTVSAGGSFGDPAGIAIATAAPVPEPGALLLLGSGLAGLGVRAWRKRKQLTSTDVERGVHAGGRR